MMRVPVPFTTVFVKFGVPPVVWVLVTTPRESVFPLLILRVRPATIPTAPVPRLRLFVPVNVTAVGFAPNVMTGLLLRVSVLSPLVLSIVPVLRFRAVLPLIALALPKFNVPLPDTVVAPV